jgi:hypothetical protein
MIQDSGARREFDSGAVRDIQEGKGRCDLIPLLDVGMMMNDVIIARIGQFTETGKVPYLEEALRFFANIHYDMNFQDKTPNYADMILDVAIHYEEGCVKYGERNWERGIPVHCFIDSGVRHYLKFLRGDKDERHDRAFVWNILGALWTIRNKPELVDIGVNNGKDDDPQEEGQEQIDNTLKGRD